MAEKIKKEVKNVEVGVADPKNKLLVVIVNRGFSENVIELSRLEGATGATILHGRGSAEIGETFMGMNITPEKEIVLIVIKEDLASAAMKRISETLGMVSAANGICFCLPVSMITKFKH